MSTDANELLSICRELPPQKVESLIDFARFLREEAHAAQDSSSDAAWEHIVADTHARPKLDAFVKEAMAEGPSEPLDPARL